MLESELVSEDTALNGALENTNEKSCFVWEGEMDVIT